MAPHRILRALDERCPERTVDAGAASAKGPAWHRPPTATATVRGPCPTDGGAIRRREIPTRLHRCTPLLEEIAVRVRSLGLVPDRMRKRRLHDRVRRMGLIDRIVAEPRPCGVDGIQPAHTELEIYFADITTRLITRAMGSDGDDTTLDRRRVKPCSRMVTVRASRYGAALRMAVNPQMPLSPGCPAQSGSGIERCVPAPPNGYPGWVAERRMRCQ